MSVTPSPPPLCWAWCAPGSDLPFRLSQEERTFVLLHERAHLRRRDHWTKPLAFVVLAVYWFHPGVWLSWLLLGRDMEMSCDEAVLRALGSQVKTKYSLSLLGFAAARRFPAPSPLAFGEHDASARIKHVLSWKKAAPAVTFLAVSLCILTVALCGTDAWPGGDALQKQGTEQAFSYEMYTWRCTLPQDTQTAQLYAETWLDGELLSSQAADGTLADQSQFRLGGRLDPLGMPQWTLVYTSDGQDTSVCQDATWTLPEGTALTNAAWTVPDQGSFHSGDALLTLDAQTATGMPVSLRMVLRYDGSGAADLARSAPKEELGILPDPAALPPEIRHGGSRVLGGGVSPGPAGVPAAGAAGGLPSGWQLLPLQRFLPGRDLLPGRSLLAVPER